MDGLRIDLGEFEKLRIPQKLTILYQNTNDLKEMIKGYKFNQKIHYIWLTVLTLAVGIGKWLGII